jgi:CRP-like cAMP-binding protein
MATNPMDAVLARVPLFAGLSKKEIRHVASLATAVNLAAGTELTHQGDHGREFLVVLEGTVDVMIDGETVATCGAGDFFGEIALLEGSKRVATVVATSRVLVEVISRADFRILLEDHPQIDAKLRAAEAQRLSENASHRSDVDRAQT